MLQLSSLASSMRVLMDESQVLRRLATSDSTQLSMRLLLPISTGYSTDRASTVINTNLDALAAAVQAYLLRNIAAYPSTSVAFLSSAVAAAPLAAITPTGPTPVPPSNANNPSPSASSPAGLAIGIIIAVVAGVVLFSVVVVRATGSCFGTEICCVPMATCCGFWPLNGGRRRRPVSKSPVLSGGSSVRSKAFAAPYPPPPPNAGAPHHTDTVLNPLTGALALRTLNSPGSPGSVPPPPPPPRQPRPTPYPGSTAMPPDYISAMGMEMPSPEHGAMSRHAIGASV